MKRDALGMKEGLLRKLDERTARIGVIGLGYVGLPLALRFAAVGYPVLGFDIDAARVLALNEGRSYLGHIAAKAVAEARASGRIEATTEVARAADCDALIVCVPTPLTRHREPDLSFVIATVDALAPHLRPGQVMVLESTTYPGTTEEELKPRIESRGFKVGSEVFLCFSPEREDPGNPDYGTRTIPRICGGTTPACLEVGLALYRSVIDRVVAVSSTQVAEMTKLLENVHRAVNIALVNEMKVICDRMGMDVHEVIRAAATKPFGFVPYWPGPGLGGHCIPIDPFYLTWKARQYGVHTRFVELAGEVNHAMPGWVIQKLADGLNDRGRPVKGSRCLVLGVAYKKNVDDLRESPALELMRLLVRRGAVVHYTDPHVPSLPREHGFELESVALDAAAVASYDVVLIATNHDAFDYALLKRHAKLIVDTRGVYLEPAANVVKA
jgi:UDP-N-acetyl-D-glucosamine dehydrogenase